MSSLIVDNSRFASLYIKIFLPFLLIRFCLHLFFFIFNKQRNDIIIDLKNESNIYDLNINNLFILFLWALKFDPYFLTLFYHRIGFSKASICRIFKSEISNFHILGNIYLHNVILYHPFSTVINAKSIGSNLKIRNNTTIGNTKNSQSNIPIIGNNVEIGANSVIIGNIKIGNNVTIGAGTLINKDVPDNAIVVGNPFRIIGYNTV